MWHPSLMILSLCDLRTLLDNYDFLFFHQISSTGEMDGLYNLYGLPGYEYQNDSFWSCVWHEMWHKELMKINPHF